MSLATRDLAVCSLPGWRGGLRSLFSFSPPQVSMSSASSGSRKREARPGPSSRFLSPPAVGASLSHTSLASWSSGGSASSRHSAKAARLAASGRAPRAVRRASDRAQQREEAQRAVATQVADRLRKRLAPYGGVCWWCLEPGHILVNRTFRSYDRRGAFHSRSREIARDRISTYGRSREIVTHPLLPF